MKDYTPASDTPTIYHRAFCELKPDHKQFRKTADKYIENSENNIFHTAHAELGQLDQLYGFADKHLIEEGGIDKYYPSVIYKTTPLRKPKSGEPDIPWSCCPTRQQKQRCSQDSLDRQVDFRFKAILAAYANGDPKFALGGSKRHAQEMNVLQFEVDYDLAPDEIVDDDFVLEHINWPLVEFLREHGVHPHFLLSGNRSTYAAFYFNEMISKATMVQFHEAIKRTLILGGKVDAHTLKGVGIRYPLSFHQKTGLICRYLGNLTRHDVIETMRGIEKDSITDAELMAIIPTIIENFPYYTSSLYGGRLKEYIKFPALSSHRTFIASLDSREMRNLEEYQADPLETMRKWQIEEDKNKKPYNIIDYMPPLFGPGTNPKSKEAKRDSESLGDDLNHILVEGSHESEIPFSSSSSHIPYIVPLQMESYNCLLEISHYDLIFLEELYHDQASSPFFT